MAKSELSVQNLVDKIERNEIRLPEMQRRYVWKSTQVRDLFDSLYRDYPSGAILLWETDEDVDTQDFAVGQNKTGIDSGMLLLDGQQRLTSLSAIIRGEPLKTKGKKRPIELLFNLDHPETKETVAESVDDLENSEEINEDSNFDESEDLGIGAVDAEISELQAQLEGMTFIVKENRFSKLPNWISVSEVFKNPDNTFFMQKSGITDMKDPRFSRYNERLTKLRGIRDYVYRLDILDRSLAYEEVTEIFVRVNSLGTRLRGSDLALAQITAKWRGSLEIFDTFQKEKKMEGFDLDLSTYLRSMVAVATDQCKFNTVGSLTKDRLELSWKDATVATNYAINFLRTNCGITGPNLLASPLLINSIAYFGNKRDYKISQEENDELRRWALLANAKGRYSRGSSESLLNQDLATIRDGGGPVELTKTLASQVGRLTVTEDDLIGKNRNSSLFKALYLALRRQKATNWDSGLEIDTQHGGTQDKIQVHHIFPKNFLKGEYSTQEIEDMANLAFIGGKLNIKISDEAPSIYLRDLISRFGEERIVGQLVPLAEDLLQLGSYQKFLAARRKLLAELLNDFLQSEL